MFMNLIFILLLLWVSYKWEIYAHSSFIFSGLRKIKTEKLLRNIIQIMWKDFFWNKSILCNYLLVKDVKELIQGAKNDFKIFLSSAKYETSLDCICDGTLLCSPTLRVILEPKIAASFVDQIA